MPHHASAIKRLRQNEKHRVRNKAVRSEMKTLMKQVDRTCEEGKQDRAAELAQQACSMIDRAWKRGVIKKNAAARKKSSVMRRLAALSATS